MNIVENTFLTLIRLGIGTSNNAKISDDVDWDALKALADKQGLTAVILDGVNEVLKTNSQLSSLNSQLKLSWIGEVIQNYERRYAQYKKAISTLAGFYNQHNYKMMVLKGYACSLYWPKPEHRPCGDIDIWQFGQQKKSDLILEQEKGIRVDNSHHHHTVFYWRDFMVENHYDFIEVHRLKSNYKLEHVFKELGRDDSNFVELNDVSTGLATKVYLPSPNLHALFLMRHMASHFTSEYISLRHILDWAFFVNHHTNDIDWRWLIEIIEKFHLLDLYNIVNAICVDDLGFDVSTFHYVQFRPDLKERVLKDILYPKYSASEPSLLIPRLLYKYRRWQGNAWKQELCYSESRWSAFWSGIWGHLLKLKSI